MQATLPSSVRSSIPTVQFTASTILCSYKGHVVRTHEIDGQDSTLIALETEDADEGQLTYAESMHVLWSAIYPFFASNPPTTADVHISPTGTWPRDALVGLAAKELRTGVFRLPRSAIFQSFALLESHTPNFPRVLVNTNLIEHPLRPPKPSKDVVYSRCIPFLNQYFSFSPCTIDNLDTIHSWLNEPRVDEFWGDKGSLDAHRKFVQDRLDDPHTLAVIGSYHNASLSTASEPATYSEIYWVKEDRLGPLFHSLDYDRGIHMLVGSNEHRGPHRIKAWLPSLVHYCFLDDVRTTRVVSEPNVQNAKMIRYLESVGFVRQGIVKFPHKDAALMICERDAFYTACPF